MLKYLIIIYEDIQQQKYLSCENWYMMLLYQHGRKFKECEHKFYVLNLNRIYL